MQCLLNICFGEEEPDHRVDSSFLLVNPPLHPKQKFQNACQRITNETPETTGHLTSLLFAYETLDIPMLSDALHKARCLKHLLLSECLYPQDVSTFFVSGIGRNKSLMTLELEGIHLFRQCEAVVAGISNHPNLTKVSLCRCRLHDTDLKVFADRLLCPKLTTLSLASNFLSSWLSISKILSNNPYLIVLHLQLNQFTLSSPAKFNSVSFSSLEYLTLANNTIGEMRNTLPVNESLIHALTCWGPKKLDLCIQNFQPAEFTSFIKNFPVSCSLKCLNLFSCGLSNEMAVLLGKAIGKNSTLVELNVSGNPDLREEGVLSLLRTGSKQLRVLNLAKIPLPGMGPSFVEAMSCNYVLWKLILNYRKFSTSYEYRLRFYLRLNRYGGRHLLQCEEAPVGLWSRVLAASSGSTDEIFYWLKEKPDLVEH